jgi:transcriptional regulator with XRE-family HTH domain
MQLHEKIRFFRHSKGITQEQIAEKLGITPVAYSNIERGESNISMKRLEEIAEALEVELLDLLSLGEKNVVVLHGYTITSHLNNFKGSLKDVNLSSIPNEISFELQKANLLLEQQTKQITLLQQEVEHLKEIIELLKKRT